jgi:sodium transport system permease protein
MKNVWTIFKKEWDRVIKDKRLVFSVMILPGLMIFLIYTFMGGAMSNLYTDDPGNVAIVSPTAGFATIYDTTAYDEQANIITITAAEVDSYKSRIDSGDWDLLIVFPADLESNLVDGYHANVQVYYNQNESQSSSVFGRFAGYLEVYGQALSYALYDDTTVLLYEFGTLPLDESQMIGQIMSSLLPMLVVMFLFAGAMAIGPESIAGEKERGTMATLLVTPVKRSEIALGKVLSLGVLSLISAVSSFIGIVSSLPKLFGNADIDISIYGFREYALILILLFSTVFVIVGVIAVISAYAKNLKEAGTLITPVYLLTIIVGVTSMFGEGANPHWYVYFLPIYNTVQSLTAIMMYDSAVVLYIAITVVANLGYTVLLVWVLHKMFNSEKIMFAK